MAAKSDRLSDWMWRDNPVNVEVTIGRTIFVLKKKALTAHSQFFRNAFGEHFKEGQTRVLNLPETDTDVFELFTTWTRTKELPSFSCSEYQAITIPAENGSRAEKLWDSVICRSYISAHMYMIDEFAAQLHDAFMEAHLPANGDPQVVFTRFPAHATLTRLFDDLPEFAPILKSLSKGLMTFFDAEPQGHTMFHFHLPSNIKGKVMMLGG